MEPVAISNRTQNSMVVNLNISKPGIVICYALENKFTLLSITTIVKNGEYRVSF